MAKGDGCLKTQLPFCISLLGACCMALLWTHPPTADHPRAISTPSHELAGSVSAPAQVTALNASTPSQDTEGLVPAHYVERLLSSSDELLRAAGGRLRAQANANNCTARAVSDLLIHDRFMARSDYLNKLGTSQLVHPEIRDIAMCTVIRNEAPRLLEWVTFHWLQGVGKFYVYDDDSTDEPERVLQKLISLGVVEMYTMPHHDSLSGSVTLQHNKMNECYKQLQQVKDKEGFTYATFLDTDEFLFPTRETNGTVSQLLNQDFKDVPCLSIQRTRYGSSMHHKAPKDGMTIQNYVMRSPVAGDGYPKVIINMSPELPQQAEGLFSVHTVEGIKCVEDVRAVRINHYIRSLEDYDLKVRTHYTAVRRYEGNPPELWWGRDRNAEFDDEAAVRFACRITNVLGHLEITH